MVFLVVFTSFAVVMASMSVANVQIAENHQEANRARAAAESGLEIMRYWLSQVQFSPATDPDQRIEAIATSLQTILSDSSITNIKISSTDSQMTVASAYLDSEQQSWFEATLLEGDGETLPLYVYGYHAGDELNDPIQRTVHVDNEIISGGRSPIFDYGIASRGPLEFPGNVMIRSSGDASDADIYIEGLDDWQPDLNVSGNAQLDGDISIGIANGSVYFDGALDIDGDQDQDAIDNHVHVGAGQVEFPIPDIEHFRQYATGQVIDDSTDTDDEMTLTNAVIEAGANPTFGNAVTVEGVLFIERPNRVTFNNDVTVHGLIVADGDVESPGDNGLTFLGNYYSEALPDDSDFDNMRSEQGSSLLAPGFGFHMNGSMHSLEGVMAVSGLFIDGNIEEGIVMKGSIINYDDAITEVNCNLEIHFDRSDAPESIAGFTGGGTATLQCVASSYSEPKIF